MPANLRQQCPPLPQASSSMALDIAAQHDREALMYHACRSLNARLNQAADEWQVTAWRWYCDAVQKLGIEAKDCPHDRLGR